MPASAAPAGNGQRGYDICLGESAFSGSRLCCLLVADREPAVGVEEVQVAGIHPELDPVAGADAAARVDSRGPQGFVLVKRDRRVLFLPLWAKVGDVLVL